MKTTTPPAAKFPTATEAAADQKAWLKELPPAAAAQWEAMQKAAAIAALTLETVYRERDPQNYAAKNAARMLREALA